MNTYTRILTTHLNSLLSMSVRMRRRAASNCNDPPLIEHGSESTALDPRCFFFFFSYPLACVQRNVFSPSQARVCALHVRTCSASLLSLLEETIKIDCLIKWPSPTVSQCATNSHTRNKQHRKVPGEANMTEHAG